MNLFVRKCLHKCSLAIGRHYISPDAPAYYVQNILLIQRKSYSEDYLKRKYAEHKALWESKLRFYILNTLLKRWEFLSFKVI